MSIGGSTLRVVMMQSFQGAVAAHGAGRLDEAEAGYRQILSEDARHPEALRCLGILCAQRGDAETAEALLRRAVAIREDVAALADLGVLLQQLHRPGEAEAYYRRALDITPDHLVAANNLGILLQGSQRYLEAEALYGRSIGYHARNAELHNNHGLVLTALGHGSRAEASFRRALAINPRYPAAASNLGRLLHDDGRWDEAESFLLHAVSIDPNHAEVFINLGNLLRQTNRAGDAEACYRRAIHLQPENALAYNNLGNLLQDAGHLPDAEAAYRRALTLRPDDIDAHLNLGNLLRETDQLGEAEALYRRAILFDPDRAEARLYLSYLLLAVGRYREAWPLYEARYSGGGPVEPPDPPFPQWQGQSLGGKSLLVWHEQGFGDDIQFIRYAASLKRRGLRHLTLLCPVPLAALMRTVEAVDEVISNTAMITRHDYWSLIMSLPLHDKTELTSIPDGLPYLSVPDDRMINWRDRMSAGTCKVGLVWKGSSLHKNDLNRSLPNLEALRPLWAVEDVRFFSLQKGEGEEEARAWAADGRLTHLGSDIDDFADTAAIVRRLDLVISVDTAVAHLAGALGTPCWVLLPSFRVDWRWLLDREDSPWYPSVMRLFRQRTPHDWSETIAEVAEVLAQSRLNFDMDFTARRPERRPAAP